MNDRDRAKVVEILRCSVEKAWNGAGGIFGAVQQLYDPTARATYDLRGRARRLHLYAVTARACVRPGWSYTYDEQCLEAAARIEEGSYP